MRLALTLFFGTFVSEDLTCIATGLLIHHGEISALVGVLSCAAGIYVSDCGLWAVGRGIGLAAYEWKPVRRAMGHRHVQDLKAWLDRNGPAAIVASRFLPGTRMPLYVTAGVTGFPLRVFATWSILGSILWTPTIVLLTAWLGDTFAENLKFAAGHAFLPSILAALLVFGLLHLLRVALSDERRSSVAARLARWSRWEFWPMWLFYAPVAAWVALLALRYRGVSTITAANPSMPDGGTVGESKFAILSALPRDVTIPFAIVGAGTIADRLATVRDAMTREHWTFPVVVKPDVGQRGLGVKLARSLDDVEAYLRIADSPLLVQPYHEGPCEAGVFYYRMPEWASGRILSITDKEFPFVAGDGQATLEQLILGHRRYRMQSGLFLERHRDALTRVLAPGERFQLAIAGNHAQGTIFRDGAALLTAPLAARIDGIAQSYPGFFVGRFDIRYRDVEAFKAGRDIAIVELNGATSESTNIYDPDTSLWSAYRQLFRQWSIVFAIGAANRARGVQVSSHRRLWQLVRAHLADERMLPASD